MKLCVALGVHPDVVSYASLVAAAASGALFWQSAESPWLLLPASLLAILRLWFNMLDGMVAIASGKASKRGEILNEVPDRISDVLVFVGVAYSGWCIPALAWWGACGSLIVAYVGTLGQALRVGRQYGGVMSKQWRMTALAVGGVVTWTLLQLERGIVLGGLTVLDWTAIIILAGIVQTLYVRLRNIFAAVR